MITRNNDTDTNTSTFLTLLDTVVTVENASYSTKFFVRSREFVFTLWTTERPNNLLNCRKDKLRCFWDSVDVPSLRLIYELHDQPILIAFRDSQIIAASVTLLSSTIS